jgi:hypothetical protein
MKLWMPSDSDLTVDEKMVLSQSAHRLTAVSRPQLRSLMEDKLERLMDQEDDPLEMLRAVPDLYLTAQLLDSNRDRAEAIVDDSSLASLVNRTNLEKPWTRVRRGGEVGEYNLPSLLGSLALSLRM